MKKNDKLSEWKRQQAEQMSLYKQRRLEYLKEAITELPKVDETLLTIIDFYLDPPYEGIRAALDMIFYVIRKEDGSIDFNKLEDIRKWPIDEWMLYRGIGRYKAEVIQLLLNESAKQSNQ